MSEQNNTKQTILVTGGAGLIGRPLCENLAKQGHKVVCLDDFSNSERRNMNENVIQVIECNLCNKELTQKMICLVQPQIIFHLACHAYEGLSQFCPNNVAMSTSIAAINVVIGAVAAKSVKRIVNFSSMARYGKGHEKDDKTLVGAPFYETFRPNPEDVYGVAKVAAERSIEILCNLHGIEWVHCVPHNVYGEANLCALADPYRGVLLIWANCLLRGKPFYIYGDGTQKRAPSYVDDCLEPMSRLGFQQNVAHQVVNIGSLQEYSMNELASIMCRVFERVTHRAAPKPIYAAPRPCEVKDAWCSIEKSVQLVGYQDKTSIEEGIEKLMKWAFKVAPNGIEPRYLESLEIETKQTPETWLKKLI